MRKHSGYPSMPTGKLEKNLEVQINNRKPYNDPPAAVYDFSHYVCQILGPADNGMTARATGFLVGPDLILTNYHVIEGTDVGQFQCRFDVKRTELGELKSSPPVKVIELLASSPYSEAEGAGSYKRNSENHPGVKELDYALLRVAEKVNLQQVEIRQDRWDKRGILELPLEQPRVNNQIDINILQHPNGGTLKAAAGALDATQLSAGTRLRYLANTENGSSGSPCFQWNLDTPAKLVLVAMHNYGDPGWYGDTAGFNQGIPVHLIRQDINRIIPNFGAINGKANGLSSTLQSFRTSQNLWPSVTGEDNYGLWKSFEIAGIEQKMRWVPSGDILLGDDRFSLKKSASVTGFWLAETACTQILYQAVTGNNPSEFIADDHPVDSVSYADAQLFIEALNKKVPKLQSRLPSENEWEYACRAGSESAYWWGDNIGYGLAHYGWFEKKKNEELIGTIPVRSFSANPWGLYQMHGNVWEWCEDWKGPRKDTRVVRGGSWYNDAGYLPSGQRGGYSEGRRSNGIGFRLAVNQ